MKTASQQAEIALITVTILHRVKTTFVQGTGSSASLEFLAREQLLSEKGGGGVLLLSREGNTNNVSPLFSGFYSLFQLPDSELNGNLSKLCFPQTLRSPRQSVLRITTGISYCQLKLNGHLITKYRSWKQNFT